MCNRSHCQFKFVEFLLRENMYIMNMDINIHVSVEKTHFFVQLSPCYQIVCIKKAQTQKCTKIMGERPRGSFRKRATTLIHDEHIFCGQRQNSEQVRDFDLRDTACGEGSIRCERYLVTTVPWRESDEFTPNTKHSVKATKDSSG